MQRALVIFSSELFSFCVGGNPALILLRSFFEVRIPD